MSEALNVRQIRGLGTELARQYLWDCIVSPPAATRVVADEESLKLRCMSSSIPENATESAEINYKSTKIQYAGRDASGKTLSLTFFDTEDLQVYKTFFNWVDYSKANPKSAYESVMSLVLWNRQQNTPILEMRLTGAFPENLGEVSLEYTGGEPINIPVTMRYDLAEIVR